MIEDGVITATSTEQTNLQDRITSIYQNLQNAGPEEGVNALVLNRDKHISYLQGGLQRLPSGFIVLDSSRPWICFWIVHSLALLSAPLPVDVPQGAIIDFLATCQNPAGGFAGGPLQLPHLAPTYAAVAALVTLGGQAALSTINRETTHSFLQQRTVHPDDGGGFTVCEGGEIDVRGSYTAMATAHMLNLDKFALAEQAGMVQHIKRCQTYEGGLGGEPGNEAHGGYTFCGLAALVLVDQAHQLDLPRLIHWAVHMQGSVEGGFMGRTNKLVDGCYSFWQGGLFPLLQKLMPDFLAQTSIPLMPRYASSSATATAGCGSGSEGGDNSDADVAVEEEEILQLTARSPERQALDDLFRTKALAESAAKSAATAEEASRAAAAADSDNAAELYHKAQHMLGASTVLQQAVQRSADNLDTVTANAAIICGSLLENPFEQSPQSTDPPAFSGRPEDGIPCRLENSACPLLYNVHALQLWLLKCCQASKGGMRDKPGKPPDYYHTCYCLSGLSSSQHVGGFVLGPPSNQLLKADPLCNVVEHRLVEALEYPQSRC
ncbi:hypothetical protein ABBQ32_012325 [Trebouxia sp. C0010 RCD-2024]